MNEIVVNGRSIGPGKPVYIIAEMSSNHMQDYQKAQKIIKAAKEAGADAVKLQTYTPDTITIDCNNQYFQIKGTVWNGQSLYELYKQAYTPWQWQPKLKKMAEGLGMDLISSPFDASAVDFLERMDVPAYKVASCEVVDLPLLRTIALTGKPVMMSTGIATYEEIDEALQTLRTAGAKEIALLKCSSTYPADPAQMNLLSIPFLADAFGTVCGLSDHTMSDSVPVAAVALGACIIEKHFTLSRSAASPDSSFSLEPDEFRKMVRAVRTAEKALGTLQYELSESDKRSRVFRRSLFVVSDVKAGEKFTEENVRSIRPGHGLHTRYLEEIVGRNALCDIKRGTPLDWDLIG